MELGVAVAGHVCATSGNTNGNLNTLSKTPTHSNSPTNGGDVAEVAVKGRERDVQHPLHTMWEFAAVVMFLEEFAANPNLHLLPAALDDFNPVVGLGVCALMFSCNTC